ncbi:MAG: hypothetical protein KF713_09605 [Turneriella sp.]|nr:hypothetical protein [Turneriella sp.]
MHFSSNVRNAPVNFFCLCKPIIWLGGFLLVTGEVFGVSWYLIPDLYTAAWRVGAYEQRTVTNQRGYQTSYPGKTTWLNSVGLHSSLVFDSGWAVTLGGAVGYVKDNVEQLTTGTVGPSATTCSGFACNVTSKFESPAKVNATLVRQDYNLAVSKKLGSSPFSIYFGGKYQHFALEGKDDNATTTNTVSYALTVAPFTSGTNAPATSSGVFSFKSSWQTVGASLGLGYTARLSESFQLVSQLSFLYVRGVFTEATYSKFTAESRDNMESYFNGYGFTFLFSLVRPITESGFLQVSLRGQYYIAQIYKRSGSYNDPISGAMISTSPDPSSSNLHNAADYIGGIQIAYVQKILGE